jgi:hypothetical protein
VRANDVLFWRLLTFAWSTPVVISLLLTTIKLFVSITYNTQFWTSNPKVAGSSPAGRDSRASVPEQMCSSQAEMQVFKRRFFIAALPAMLRRSLDKAKNFCEISFFFLACSIFVE